MADDNRDDLDNDPNTGVNANHDDHLDGDDGDNTENVSVEEFLRLKEEKTRMEAALKRANESDKNRRLKLKELEEVLGDTNPEDIRKWREQMAELERKKDVEKGNFDKLRQQMEEQKQREIAERDTKLAAMQETLEKNLIDAALATAMTKYDVNPELSDVFLKYIRPQFKVMQEDGKYVQRVVDESGDPQLNMYGDYKSVDDVFKELKESEKFGVFFRARHASGGGSNPGRGEGGKSSPRYKSREDMTDRQKIEFIKKYGREEYEKIPVTRRLAETG